MWNTLAIALLLSLAALGWVLWPLFIMIIAFKLFFVTVLLLRTRNEVLDRERRSAWVGELMGGR